MFKTEIYHVDGKGEEGGVVFSEMQAREGSLSDVLDQSLRKILYGKRNAYRSETGGKLDALRKLTVQDSASLFAPARRAWPDLDSPHSHRLPLGHVRAAEHVRRRDGQGHPPRGAAQDAAGDD